MRSGLDGAAVRDDTGDPTVVDDGCGLGLVDELGSGLGGGIHECGVEASAGPHRTVVGEAIRGRPVEFAHLLAGDHPQAADVVGVVERDLQLVQGADGTWGEPVAADLVASVGALLEHDHSGAGPGGLDRRRGARGAGTDHGDVDSFGTHGHHAAGTGREKHRRAPDVTPPRTAKPDLRCSSVGTGQRNCNANREVPGGSGR